MNKLKAEKLNKEERLLLEKALHSIYRKVHIYNKLAISVQLETLHLGEVRPLVHSVLRDRYESALCLLDFLGRANLQPYEPLIISSHEFQRLLCPPVIEFGTYASVLDGAHRLFAAVGQGLETVEVISIRADNLPKPASKAFNWSDVKVEEKVDHWQDRTAEFVEGLFRPIVGVSAWLERQPIDRQCSFEKTLDALCKNSGPPMMTFKKDKTSACSQSPKSSH